MFLARILVNSFAKLFHVVLLCQLLISLRTIFMLMSGLFKNVIIISIFIIHFHYSFWSTIMIFIFWYFDFHNIQWWDLLLNCYSLHSLAHFVTSWHFVKLSKVDTSPEIHTHVKFKDHCTAKLDKYLINSSNLNRRVNGKIWILTIYWKIL